MWGWHYRRLKLGGCDASRCAGDGRDRTGECVQRDGLAGSNPHVRRFAYSLCASPEDAEDAAQEALLILYRKIGMLRATGVLAS